MNRNEYVLVIILSIVTLIFLVESGRRIFKKAKKVCFMRSRIYKKQAKRMNELIEQYYAHEEIDWVDNITVVGYKVGRGRRLCLYYSGDKIWDDGNIVWWSEDACDLIPDYISLLESTINLVESRRRWRIWDAQEKQKEAKRKQAEIEADKKMNPWKYESCARCGHYQRKFYSDGDHEGKCLKHGRYWAASQDPPYNTPACRDFV